MKNKMEQVAQILGVELEEEFNIVGGKNNPYILTTTGLRVGEGFPADIPFVRLLCGELEIEKTPFKPTSGQYYYSINHEGDICCDIWNNHMVDFYCYNANNCFRTKEEITQEDIDRILKEMTGKYNGI